ncbi:MULTISPECIES: hypothetical protein [unclassified Streptomyces]|uniref:hypothetical protein n=1 Tax=unclassified Streptomyces TaxID=2593676 RepID=UPI002255EF89|nr:MULTISPECIES: hypothetical protein [unclassified Streptomyces]MCX4976505.1 hypothetical protein [Streptomyces sp. NBC_00620]WRZ24374.1 hypothetical protein OHT59_40600 [Streptomyces sp. NBC_00243]
MTATPFVDPYRQAAQRARVVAEIARDRFAPPETLPYLNFMAAYLETAARLLDAQPPGAYEELPTEATEALFRAEQIAVEHPAARIPAELGEYVLVPLVDRPLPFPNPLGPVSARYEKQEADLVHALHLLHDDGEHQRERTDDWLREVFTIWRKRMRLADDVRVDNARPCNQR